MEIAYQDENDQFSKLPEHILILVATHLHWSDILALECVNRRIRATVTRHFWPQVTHLVYYALEHPLNPLSVDRLSLRSFGDVHHAYNSNKNFTFAKIRAKIIVGLLKRCGFQLRTLDLDISRWMHRIVTIYGHRDKRVRHWKKVGGGLEPLDVAAICTAVAQCCSSLRVLDLSGMAMQGCWLASISEAVGSQLVVVRLNTCFFQIGDAQDNDRQYLSRATPTPIEWSQFLRGMPQLQCLDISNNFGWPRGLPFDNISTRLRKLNALDTKLNIASLVEIGKRAPQLCELRVQLFADFAPEQTRELFTLLNGLESLWIQKMAPLPHLAHSALCVLNLSAACCRQLKHIQIVGPGGDQLHEAACPELYFEPMHPLSALSQLHLSYELFSDIQLSRMANSIAANVTTLSFAFCRTLNDNALQQIATVGRLHALTVICCANVSWLGFAAFLEHCPQINYFAGIEQMTDKLLKRVMRTMDERQCSCHASVTDKTDAPPLFYFIRLRLEPYYAHDYVRRQPRHPNCVQSRSKNMHPRVVYREAVPRDPDPSAYLWPQLMLANY